MRVGVGSGLKLICPLHLGGGGAKLDLLGDATREQHEAVLDADVAGRLVRVRVRDRVRVGVRVRVRLRLRLRGRGRVRVRVRGRGRVRVRVAGRLV